MKLTVHDKDGTQMILVIDSKDFFVDGQNFGHQKYTYCYAPVFTNNNEKQSERERNTWIAGSLVWNNYVVVLDNTPTDEDGKPYAAIGLGLRNKNGNDLSTHYKQESLEGGKNYIKINDNDMSYYNGPVQKREIDPT